MSLELATREKIKLRMCILGATGSGKTATALLFATALARHYGGKIGVIDTQNRQSRDYANTRFAPLGFYPIDINGGNPLAYINALQIFAKEGDFSVVIVDSMTSAWQEEGGVLDSAGDNAQFSEWSGIKKPNFKMFDTIQKSPFHVIATVLADTQYLIKSKEDSGTGKMSIDIVGTKPIQDKKMMPKFGVQCSMDQYHRMTVTRTSFEPYDRMIIEKPGEDWMLPLIKWLDEGDEPQTIEIASRAASLEKIAEYYDLANRHGLTRDTVVKEFFKKYGSKPEECAEDFLEERLTELRAKRIVTPSIKTNGDGSTTGRVSRASRGQTTPVETSNEKLEREFSTLLDSSTTAAKAKEESK